MISMKAFAENVVALSKTITEYVWGATGENGQCDCVGLVIGALRMGGVSWGGTNGTNWTARNEMRYLTPLENADKLQVGMVVLKSRAPGQNGYALPYTYKNDPDQNDYYHIGTVTNVEPLVITHCTSPGPIKQDNNISGWSWYGELDHVAANADSTPDTMKPMVVTGGKLALRNGPGTNYQVLRWIPDDADVLAAPYDDVWSRVNYAGVQGYSMSRYLLSMDGGQDDTDNVVITVDHDTAAKMLEALQRGLK